MLRERDMFPTTDLTRREWLSRSGRAIGGLLGLALLAPVATAQEQRRDFEVEVWAIRATKSNDEISPELRSIAGELKERFRYRGFKLEKRDRGSARPGQEFEARLGGGHRCTVKPIERDKRRIVAQVTAEKGGREVAKTKIEVRAGAAHLMGGWKYDDKGADAMVLLVRIR